MNIYEIKARLYNLKVFGYQPDVSGTLIISAPDTNIRCEYNLNGVNQNIDIFIDFNDNYKMVEEFILLNGFINDKPGNYHFSAKYERITVLIACPYFYCNSKKLKSSDLIQRLRKKLDLDSLSKPVIDRE